MGDDAAGFLQGQTTGDMQALRIGETGCGAFCTPKGRVIANFRVVRVNEGFHLLLAADLVEAVRQRLQIFVLRSRVTLEPLGHHWQLLGILGTGLPHDEPAPKTAMATDHSPGWPEAAGYSLMKLHDGTPRQVLVIDAWRPDLLASLSRQAQPLHPDAWRLQDILAGFPLVKAATREEFLPQMLNLDLLGGISFKKGCYTGQEIVTRTHYLGKLKRRMHRFGCDTTGVPAPGAPVYDTLGAEPVTVGQVVNACRATPDAIQCLAVLSIEHAESGSLSLTAWDGPPLARKPLPYPLSPTG
jgi:hypothetical protein